MKIPGSLVLHNHLSYATAWDLQKSLLTERAQNLRSDTLLLLEHEPVFTLGRSASSAHWSGDESLLRADGFSVYHVERGGSVTYHGPGQIVGYPILRLNQFCSGPKGYMRLLEEVVLRTVAAWGIHGRRIEKLTGVWVGEDQPEKIAAMGVRITQGITMHGFALNVMPDLAPYQRIVPCGIAGCRITSMAALLNRPIDVLTVKKQIADLFADVFGISWTDIRMESLTETKTCFSHIRTGRSVR